MHQIHKEIGLPRVVTKEISAYSTEFIVGALPTGYGMTLSNSLRRVLFSSLVGTAVTGVKIKGASHEFTSLDGVTDNLLDIVLRLKKLQVNLIEGQDEAILELKAKKGATTMTAADIKTPAGVTVVNKSLELTSTAKDVDFVMQIRVNKGVGYSTIADLEQAEDAAEWILIDASFSPIVMVNYDITETRVGQWTNLEELHMIIETNGAITPVEAFIFASNILRNYFEYFNKDGAVVEPDFMTNEIQVATKVVEDVKKKEVQTPVEVLDLSPRTLNALIRGKITYVEELVKYTPSQLNIIRGFGKRGMTEVQKALEDKKFSKIS